MSLPAGVVTGSSSSRLSAPRTQAMIWSRIVLLPSIARPAVIAPLALVNAVMLETVTVTTGLIVAIGLPATTVPPGAPLEPVLNVALVILNVVVLGTSATEAIDQEPLYTANPPVAPVTVMLYGNGPLMLCGASVVTVRTLRPAEEPVVG